MQKPVAQIVEFREKLNNLSREEILGIIDNQHPETPTDIGWKKEILRKEWVFRNKLSHISDNHGDPIVEGDYTDEELIRLVDPPFIFSKELMKKGFTEIMQRQIHIASDPVLWAQQILGVTPRSYQALVMRDDHENVVLRFGRRLGKALDVDTEIPTSIGWQRMGDLQVGDGVFDENGKECNIEWVSEIHENRECYKVHFSDGNSIVADAEHQWTVRSKASRKSLARSKKTRRPPQVMTTEEMIPDLYLNRLDGGQEVNYSIDVAKPVEYSEKELPVDPWLFGLWLADGTSCRPDITIGKEDQIETLSLINESGYVYRQLPYQEGTITFRIDSLFDGLKSLSVVKNYATKNGVEKFIPDVYLQTSVEQREELLKGLMDGDGTVSNQENGNVEFSVCNERLARGAYELIQSLGYRATFKEGEAKLHGRVTGTRYRINFTPWNEVFKLKRKVDKQILRTEPSSKQKYRYITAIEKVDSVSVKCISVDSESKLFLASRSYIPTHNSYLLVMYMLWYAYVFPRARILVLAPAKTQVALIYEAILEMAGNSPILMDAINRKVKSPQHEVWLTNGATIKLFTTGLKNGSRSDGARGQEADMIVLDEMDYMGSDDLVALMAMLQNTDSSKTFSKKLIGASTPTGQRSTYWRWNVDPTENFNAYFSPSYVNPGWNSEEEAKARIRYKNEQHYRHEIEADWGEDADGVYGRKYVDQSFNILPEWDYNSIKLDHDKFLYTLGVDWDKHGAGVNIVAVEAPRGNPYGGPVKVIYRDEVRKGDFTYLESIDEIVKLHSRFNFDHLYVDQGSGEVQAELLHKYGLDNPQTQMHTRAKAWHFSNTIEVRDPYTRQIEKKRLKPYMVDNLSHYLEQGKIIFNSGDDELFLQLISYIKIRESESGHPVFAAGGEAVDHAHDALLLALFAITHNYDSMFDNYVSTSPQAISNTFFMPGNSQSNKKTGGLVNDDYVDWDLTSSSKKTESKEDGSHSFIPRRTSFNNSRPNSSRAAVKRKTF